MRPYKGSFALTAGLAALLAVFVPAPVSNAQTPYPKQLSLGELQSCELMSDGSVKCWGLNNEGQVINLPGPYAQVSASIESTCVLSIDGSQDYCYGHWGSPLMVDAVGKLGPFTQLADRLAGACGLRPNGDVLCWNWDTQWELAGPFAQIAAYGNDNVCGLVPAASGTPSKPAGAYCWGHLNYEDNGYLLGNFTEVAVGGSHTCAISAVTGGVYCRGSNTYGQSNPPSGAFLQVAAGKLFTCGIRTDHTLACWGYNFYGQVSNTPAGQFKQVAAGTGHACAISVDNQVYCWGRNDVGQAIPPNLFESHVPFDFHGFYPFSEAEQDDPTLNTVKAGRAVPLKFSLGGDQGLNVIEAGSPASQPLDCEQMDPRGDLEPVQSSSGLTYDPQNEKYTYLWETEPDWAGTCRILSLTLTDGSVHLVAFQFHY